MDTTELDIQIAKEVNHAFATYLTGTSRMTVKPHILATGQRPTIGWVLVKSLKEKAYTIQSMEAKECLLDMYCDMNCPLAPHVRNGIASLLKQREFNAESFVPALAAAREVFADLQKIKPVSYELVNKDLRYTKTMKERVDAFHQNCLVGIHGKKKLDTIPQTLQYGLSAPVVVDNLDQLSKPFLVSYIEAVMLYMSERYEQLQIARLKSEINDNALDKNIL